MRSIQTAIPALLRWTGACALAGALAACSGAPATQAPITVSLTNFSLAPSAASAKAGNVTFVATNNAPSIQHELIVIKTDLAADKLTVESDDKVNEDAMKSYGEVSELDTGKSGTVTLNLDAGHYVLICNVASHYRLGMHVDFTVNP
jgi:uncharacterized cupredoxin-like copper-binding protein